MGGTSLSRGDLWSLATVLAGSGAVDAGYLTWQWYASASASWCDINAFFSCTRVRESPFAQIAGVPVALLGLVGFLLLVAVGAAAMAGVLRIGRVRMERVLLVVAAVGAGIGTGLTVIEVAVIESVCILCAIGFGLDLGVLGIAVALVRKRDGPADRPPGQGFI